MRDRTGIAPMARGGTAAEPRTGPPDAGTDRPDRYAPWEPAAIFLDAGRKRAAARMLHHAGVFPRAGDACLEVGFGTLGWLGHLIDWGVRERDLHGIELRGDHACRAREILPLADLRVGDAARLPWEDGAFRLAVASMVFTAIPEPGARRRAAAEIARTLAPGGALLWYDIAVDSPWNPRYHRVSRGELRALFPGWEGEVRSVCLPPPLLRLVAPRSWTLAVLLEAVPLLRPYLLAVLVKPAAR